MYYLEFYIGLQVRMHCALLRWHQEAASWRPLSVINEVPQQNTVLRLGLGGRRLTFKHPEPSGQFVSTGLCDFDDSLAAGGLQRSRVHYGGASRLQAGITGGLSATRCRHNIQLHRTAATTVLREPQREDIFDRLPSANGSILS